MGQLNECCCEDCCIFGNWDLLYNQDAWIGLWLPEHVPLDSWTVGVGIDPLRSVAWYYPWADQRLGCRTELTPMAVSCPVGWWWNPQKKKKESIFFFFAKPNRFEQNVRFWFEGGCGGVNPLSSRKYGVIMKQELKRRTKRKPKWGRWWGTKHEQKKLVELQKKGQAKELWRRREVRLVEERIRISKRGFYIKPIRFGLGWGRQTNNLYVTPWPDRCWTSKLLQIPARHLSVINLVSSGLVGFFRSRQAFGNFFHPWCTVSPISLYFCRI